MFTDINPDDCATDKDLECNIVDDTSGDLKRILVSAVQVRILVSAVQVSLLVSAVQVSLLVSAVQVSLLVSAV